MPAVASLAAFLLAAWPAAPRAGCQDAAAPWPRFWEGESAWENPNGRAVAEEQVFPHTPYSHGWQSYFYNLVVRLDDGTLLNICPFHWRYGLLDSWGMYIVAGDRQGHVFSWDGTFTGKEVQAADTGMKVHAGASSFESAGNDHRWKVAVPGFSCDLAFTNILPAWMPGDGIAYYTPDTKNYFRYAVPAPLAHVTGTVTVFGRTVPADGQCFYDTVECVTPLSRTNEEVNTYRTFSPPETPPQDSWFVFLYRIRSHPGFGSLVFPMVLVAHGSVFVLTSREVDFAVLQTDRMSDLPYPYAAAVAVSARQGGAAITGTFTSERPFHVQDIFARLPPLFREVASWFLKRPVVFRGAARFTGEVTLPDGSRHRLDLDGMGEQMVAR
jgi:hypothetical protein